VEDAAASTTSWTPWACMARSDVPTDRGSAVPESCLNPHLQERPLPHTPAFQSDPESLLVGLTLHPTGEIIGPVSRRSSDSPSGYSHAQDDDLLVANPFVGQGVRPLRSLVRCLVRDGRRVCESGESFR